MTWTRRVLLVLAVIGIAAILAFPLRETIYQAVIIPLAFLGWQLGLFYRSLSQGIWWLVVMALVLFMLGYSLMPQLRPRHRQETRSKPRRGPVEDLAFWLGRARSGVYYKWLIANRLGKLSYQILVHRESGRPRSVFAPLLGTDWEPSPELQSYLETGLHGSFLDFANAMGPLGEPPKTPLDYEVQEAVAFLELQVANDQSPQRQ